MDQGNHEVFIIASVSVLYRFELFVYNVARSAVHGLQANIIFLDIVKNIRTMSEKSHLLHSRIQFWCIINIIYSCN